MKTQQYNCPSYYDYEVKGIVDCTCGKCTIKPMKTYTQKQYDSAKERAYKKGYAHGTETAEAVSNAHYEDVLESASDVKEWKKWEQFNFDWTVTLLVVACVVAILMMIF